MERFEKQLTAIIIFPNFNYFRNITFSCPLVHELNMMSLFYVKKHGARVKGQGIVNFDIHRRNFTVIYSLLSAFNIF